MVKQVKERLKIKSFIGFTLLLSFIVFACLSYPKKSYALETVVPLVIPQTITGFYMCVFPGSFAAGTTALGTATITGITTSGSLIQAAIQREALVTDTNFKLIIANDNIKPVSDFFSQLWLEMLNAYFRKMTSNFSVLEANQERMLGSIMDATEQNRAIRETQKEQAEASRSLRPSESLQMVATVVGGLQRSKNIQQGYNLASAGILLNRTSVNETAENVTGTGEEENFSGGSHVELKKRWDKYVAKYCDKNENAGSSGCEDDGILMGKDINLTDTIFSRETIEIADQGIADAVNDLVINIAEPIVTKPMPKGLYNSTEGKQAILDMEAYKSRRQVILDAVNQVVSRRLPGSQMGPYMQNLRKDVGMNEESLSSLAPYNPSYNEIMHYMTSERFRTGAFSVDQIDEPENNQRERVVQSAFFLMQLNDMSDLLDKQSMLLTAQVSASINDSIEVSNSGIGSMSSGGSGE